MTPTGRRWARVTPGSRRGAAWLIALMVQMAGHATALGQAPPAGLATREVLPAPSVVAAPGEARRRLERLRWLVDNQHWNDAAELANELLTKATDGWVAIDRERYVGFREAVHRAVAAGGPEALAAYRSLVDPLAEAWLSEGEKKLDADLLWRIVDEAYASSAGDDALWSLGELALERGDYQMARWAWQQVRPETTPAGCLGYPDSPIELAAVRTRLALVSIRAGDRARARREVRQLATEHAAATGRLGGREVNYAKRLGELMEQAEDWPPVEAGSAEWPTLGGTPQRTNVAPISVTKGGEFQQIWSVTVEAPATPIVEPTTLAELAPRARRPIFPVVAQGVVLYQDASGVHAYHLETGKPAGGEGGLIFAAPKPQEPRPRSNVARSANSVSAIYAMTVSDGRLLAVASQLVCLDLNREGALVFGREPAAGAAFSAPPLGDESRAAVVELHRGVGMSAAVVGFDFWRREPHWRRGLASVDGSEPVANTPVLSADASFVYVSSDLGFIAVVRADNGAPLWLRTYSRKPVNDGAAYARALDPRPNPCIVHGSLVLAAPRDSGEVLALDAASGALVWSKPLPAADAQLLAVDRDEAFLSGDRLWKLDVETGKIDPHGGEELRGGAGHGVLAGDAILWPIQHEIVLVDRRTGRPAGSSIELPVGGGANLAVAAGAGGEGQYIVAAGPTHVTVFRQTPANATTRDE